MTQNADMGSFVSLFNILVFYTVMSRVNAMHFIDCSNKGLQFHGRASINFTCGVQSDGELCPLQDSEINLEIVKHSEINLTDYYLGWTPKTCTHSVVLCPDCYQDFSPDVGLVFEGFNISNNNFSVIPCFSQWSQLEWIDLSNNKYIRSITHHLFFGNDSHLERMKLQNVQQRIHPNILLYLEHLHYLDLSHNSFLRDYSIVATAKSLTILDVRFSCNEYSIICPRCFGNVTIIVSNVTACSLHTKCPDSNCTFWYDEFEVFPSYHCLEKSSTIPTSVNDYTTSSGRARTTTMTLPHTVDVPHPRDFCQEFSNLTSLHFLSEKPYCGISLLMIAMIFIIGVLILVIVRWRIKVRRQGRYGRWMSLYSPKVSYQVKEEDKSNDSSYRALDNSSDGVRMECDGTSNHSSKSSNEDVIIDSTRQSLENTKTKHGINMEHVQFKISGSSSLKSKQRKGNMPLQYSLQRLSLIGNDEINNNQHSLNGRDEESSSCQNPLPVSKKRGWVTGRRSLALTKDDYDELSQTSLQNKNCSRSEGKIYEGLKKGLARIRECCTIASRTIQYSKINRKEIL